MARKAKKKARKEIRKYVAIISVTFNDPVTKAEARRYIRAETDWFDALVRLRSLDVD